MQSGRQYSGVTPPGSDPPQKFTVAPAALRRARAFRDAAVQLLRKPWAAAKVKPPRRLPVGGAEAAERLPGKAAEPVVRNEAKPGRHPLCPPQRRLLVGLLLHGDPAALFPAGRDAGRAQSERWAVRHGYVWYVARGCRIRPELTLKGRGLAEHLVRTGAVPAAA